MSAVEERLRDALAAQAGLVDFDPHAYATVVERRDRRRTTRWLRPVGALAATVLVAGLAAVALARGGDRVVPASGAPARLVAIQGPSTSLPLPRTVVLDARTGAVLLATNDLDGVPRAVAAVGDGRTFYAALEDDCLTKILRMEVPGGFTEVARVRGKVDSLAASPDGRRLAYSYQPDPPCRSGGLPWQAAELRVKDLPTGKERTWRSEGEVVLRDLAWSPDGRYLAYEYNDIHGIERLDTTAPGREFPLPPQRKVTPRPFCYPADPAYLPSGELVAAIRCFPKGGSPTIQVRPYDVATKQAGRELFRLPRETNGSDWLALDATGRYALAAVGSSGRGRQAYYLAGDDVERRPDLDDVIEADW
jgi:hypothetical protein